MKYIILVLFFLLTCAWAADPSSQTWWHKFGYNDTVAGTIEDVWEGSAPYMYLSDAQRITLTSDSTADSTDGTGALTVEIQGLDSSYLTIKDTMTCLGVDIDTSARYFLRLYRAIVLTAGSQEINAGILTFKNTAGDTTLALISKKSGQTLMALWTVPANTTFCLRKYYISETTNKSTQVYLFVKPFGGVYNLKHHAVLIEDTWQYTFDRPLEITEKSEITIRAMSEGGGGKVSAGFSGWY